MVPVLHLDPINNSNKAGGQNIEVSVFKKARKDMAENIKVLKNVDKTDSFHLGFILESQIALAKSKLLNSGPIPNDYDQIYEEVDAEHKLKIFLQSYISPEKTRVNRIMAEWYVPVTPEQFAKFMNNTSEQLKVGEDAIESIKPVLVMNETDEQVFVLYYISYKKTAFGGASDLLFMRHSTKIDATHYADSLVSVKHPDYPVTNNHIRCEYKFGGHLVKLVSGKENGKPISYVRMCLELDFKINLPAHLARSYSQSSLKEYVERSIKRLKILHPY